MSFVFGGLFARREIQTAKIAKELWIIGMLKGISNTLQRSRFRKTLRPMKTFLSVSWAVLLIKFMINER